MARIAEGWSRSRTMHERQSGESKRTSRRVDDSPSVFQAPRSCPRTSESMRTTLNFSASNASPMSSAALSGSAAAITTRPFSSSRTISQLTVRASSGNGLMAFRIGSETATGSSSGATRTIFTSRRLRGNARTASRLFSPEASMRNFPPSKAATCASIDIGHIIPKITRAC